jgi:hypothetical protein
MITYGEMEIYLHAFVTWVLDGKVTPSLLYPGIEYPNAHGDGDRVVSRARMDAVG